MENEEAVEKNAILHENRIVTENPDKLEIGTPAKGGAIKVSGDFNDPEAFKKKIDNAIEVRKYANAQISIL